MSLKQTFSNPFYALLLLAGLAFSITACAYGVMIVRGLRVGISETDLPVVGDQLMGWLDHNGFALMLIELATLAIFCLLAITTDAYWERRSAAKKKNLR